MSTDKLPTIHEEKTWISSLEPSKTIPENQYTFKNTNPSTKTQAMNQRAKETLKLDDTEFYDTCIIISVIGTVITLIGAIITGGILLIVSTIIFFLTTFISFYLRIRSTSDNKPQTFIDLNFFNGQPLSNRIF